MRRPRPRTLIPSLLATLAFVSLEGALLLAAPAAHADTFGGFSATEPVYLTGRDTICSPLAVDSAGAGAEGKDAQSSAIPTCRKAKGSEIAEHRFRRGSVQQGGRARYAATAQGTTLTIQALQRTGNAGGTVVTWRTTDPISRVLATYLSDSGALLAVEYESRFGGRVRTETVAFVVEKTPAPAETPAATPGTIAVGEPSPAPASKELDSALAAARKLDRRGGKAAIAAFKRVLALDPDHSEARYGLARALVRARQADDGIAELTRLAASSRPDAVVWRVEARFDKVFRALRERPAFRSAVGLDRTSGTKSLYERLVGFAQTWEQAEIKCQQAQINLDLARLERTFALRVTSRCGGYEDHTRLKGRWSLGDGNSIVLTLPNKAGPEDTIACVMQTCNDGAGEDCLACGVDSDLSFVARPVRR